MAQDLYHRKPNGIDKGVSLSRGEKKTMKRVLWLCFILFGIAFAEMFMPAWPVVKDYIIEALNR